MNIESFTKDIELEISNAISLFEESLMVVLLSNKSILNESSLLMTSLTNDIDAILRKSKNISKFSMSKFDGESSIGSETLGEVASFEDANRYKFKSLLDGAFGDVLSLKIAYDSIGIADKIGKDVKNIISGRLNSRSKNLIGDYIFGVDSIITLAISADKNINRFEYVGVIDDKNRSWCESHIYNTYTKEEIMDWEKHSWTGKIGGNPFIYRGGYGCRHYFKPITGESK